MLDRTLIAHSSNLVLSSNQRAAAWPTSDRHGSYVTGTDQSFEAVQLQSGRVPKKCIFAYFACNRPSEPIPP